MKLPSPLFVGLALCAAGLLGVSALGAATIRSVEVAAEDLVYDPGTDRLFASVSEAGGFLSNSIVAIDPASGTVVGSVRVGRIEKHEVLVSFQSGKLARSTDGQFLYVAVSNATTVSRYDIASGTVGPSFSLGLSTPFNRALRVSDMAVVPGSPTSVAIARTEDSALRGVAVYDHGVPRAISTPGSPSKVDRIAFGADGETLYGYNSRDASGEFVRMAVNASGATIIDESTGLLEGLRHDIFFGGGLVFGSQGIVLDPATKTVRARLPIGGGLVAPDPESGRVFALVFDPSGLRVQPFDIGTGIPLSGVALSEASAFKTLVRCGPHGLAYPTRDGKVHIVNSPLLFPGADRADLVVSQSWVPAVDAGEPFEVSVTVSNRGPDAARNIVLTGMVPVHGTLVSIAEDEGNWTNENGRIVVRLGGLGAGESRAVRTTFAVPFGGWNSNHVFAVGDEFDPDYHNNVAMPEVFIRAEPPPGGISEFRLPTTDLVSVPGLGRLIASVPGRAGGRGDRLLRLDPARGLQDGMIDAGQGPGKMALSEDSRLLYVAINTNRWIRRVDVASGTPELAFPLGDGGVPARPLSVEDMVVLPGNPNAVAVSRLRQTGTAPGSSLSFEAMSVYDDGVARPTTGRPENAYSYGDSLVFGEDSSVLYAHNLGPTGFSRFSINENGVVHLDSDAALMGSSTSNVLVMAEGLAYGTTGNVADPVARSHFGKVPGMTNATSIVFDPGTRRLFYLHRPGTHWMITAIEAGSLLNLGSVALPGATGVPGSLVRWGADGLAFRTSGDQLFLLRTSLVPTSEAADLALSVVAKDGSATAGDDFAFTLSVTNTGPGTALDVVLTSEIPAPFSLVGAAPSQGSWTNEPGLVRCALGDLAPGNSVEVSFTVAATTNGLFGFASRVEATTLDRTNANNHVGWLTWVGGGDAGSSADPLLRVADIASDPVSGRLYSIVPADSGRFANSLFWLDPATREVGGPFPVGQDPKRLAASSDGGTLFVALDGIGSIRRFDVATRTAAEAFKVQSGKPVAEMRVNPTNASEIVVLDSDKRIARYNHGVKAPREVTGMAALAYLDTTGELFAGASGFYRIVSQADGLVRGEQLPASPSSTAELKSAGGRLYFQRGMEWDPATGRVIAVAPGPQANSLVEADPASGRVFRLTQDPGAFGEPVVWTLRIYDAGQSIEIGALRVPGLVGTPLRLVRWGAEGLAVCTSAGQLLFVGGNVLPRGPETDVRLDQMASAETASANDPVSFALSLTNAGTSIAHGLVVTQAFVGTVSGTVVSTTAGSATITADGVTWTVDRLEPGTAVSAVVTTEPAEPGSLMSKAWVRHVANDAKWADNACWSVVNVVPPGSAPASIRLRLATTDLAFDPVRHRIYASIPTESGLGGNAVAAISPSTGNLLDRFPVGSQPERIAVSPDGRHLRVALKGTAGTKRFDLETGAADQDHPFDASGVLYPIEMRASPTDPEVFALAVGGLFSGSPPTGSVLLYRDGIQLSGSGGPVVGLSFSDDGQVLFGGNPKDAFGPGFSRMVLAPGGIALSERVAGFTSHPGRVLQNNGRLYGESGEVVDPFLPLVIGALPASGLHVLDRGTGRAFYLGSSGGGPVSLTVVDTASLRVVAEAPVHGVEGQPETLILCGPDRLAFRTTSNQVFIVTSPAAVVAPLAQADVGVRLAAYQDFHGASETLRFVFTVTNQGPASASNVVLAIRPPVSVTSAALVPEPTKGSLAAGGFLSDLGDLPAGGARRVELAVGITNTATFSAFASVSSVQPDPNPSDNRADASVDALYFQRAGSVLVRDWPTTCLAYDRLRRRVVAGQAIAGHGGRIVFIDPGTASQTAAVDVAEVPGLMRVSDDGRHLHVASLSGGSVRRIDLTTLSTDLRFDLPFSQSISAMAVLPGDPGAIVVNYRTAAGWETVVHDDGVPRSLSISGLQARDLEPSPSGETLYSYGPNPGGGFTGDVVRFRVSDSGLTAEGQTLPDRFDEQSEETAYFDGRLFFSNGDIMETSTWGAEPKFPLPHLGVGMALLPEADRAAFLIVGPADELRARLLVYSVADRQLRSEHELRLPSPHIADLLHCGADRFAFRSRDQVVFIRTGGVLAANPADPGSLPRFREIRRSGDEVLVSFQSDPGAIYHLESSSDLSSTNWSVWSSPIHGAAGPETVVRTNLPSGDTLFLRLRVDQSDP